MLATFSLRKYNKKQLKFYCKSFVQITFVYNSYVLITILRGEECGDVIFAMTVCKVFKFTSAVKGFNVYRKVWKPNKGQHLNCSLD